MNSNMQRAIVLLQQSNHIKATDELRQVLANDPDDATAHALLGICLAEQKKYADATAEAKQAVHLAPDNSLSHYSLASVLESRNRFKEALPSINEAIRIDPFNTQYHSKASAIHFAMRNWKESLASAEQGLQVNPEDVSCSNLRSMALVKLGRKTEARGTLEGVLSKSPDNATSHASQGWALLESNQHEKAMEHFREALRLDPKMEWARVGILTAMRARNPIYNWLLKFFLAMSKLTRGGQWGVILGLYIGYRILGQIANANPQWAPFIQPLLILYVVFVVLTWIANPLFNLVLRLDKFGRLALTKKEIAASNVIGGMLLIAIVSLAGYFLGGPLFLLPMAVVGGLLIMPVSAVFRCESGWPLHVMLSLTALLVLLGFGAVLLAPTELGARLLIMFAVGVFATTIAGNFVMGATVKH